MDLTEDYESSRGQLDQPPNHEAGPSSKPARMSTLALQSDSRRRTEPTRGFAIPESSSSIQKIPNFNSRSLHDQQSDDQTLGQVDPSSRGGLELSTTNRLQPKRSIDPGLRISSPDDEVEASTLRSNRRENPESLLSDLSRPLRMPFQNSFAHIQDSPDLPQQRPAQGPRQISRPLCIPESRGTAGSRPQTQANFTPYSTDVPKPSPITQPREASSSNETLLKQGRPPQKTGRKQPKAKASQQSLESGDSDTSDARPYYFYDPGPKIYRPFSEFPDALSSELKDAFHAATEGTRDSLKRFRSMKSEKKIGNHCDSELCILAAVREKKNNKSPHIEKNLRACSGCAKRKRPCVVVRKLDATQEYILLFLPLPVKEIPAFTSVLDRRFWLR
ncbi:unnamed protein product [Periconia digitata]|uniref:Uncharacterized protein n=1 Tax=Periconia digitata TaxID=1303443 RepID=A0A9W4UPK9_9PLEO|nr:unnamed protein product [Periconia digitata]